jgi:hypothetical protein
MGNGNECPAPGSDWTPPVKPYDVNFFVTTPKWIMRVGGNRVELTKKNKRTFTLGGTIEIIQGSKLFYVIGALVEIFMAYKFEQVVGAETKINVGVRVEVTISYKSEAVFGGSLELNRGPKWHLCPSANYKWFTPERVLVAAEEKRLVKTMRHQITERTRKFATYFESIKNLQQEIASATNTVSVLTATYKELAQKSGAMTVKAKMTNLKVSGSVTIAPGSFLAEAKGANVLQGASVKLEGGGGTVDVGGTIDINGKMFVN